MTDAESTHTADNRDDDHTLPLTESMKSNFETLCRAVRGDAVCLLSCLDRNSGTTAPVVCAVNYEPNAEEPYELVPFAILLDDEKPCDQFVPPHGLNDSSC